MSNSYANILTSAADFAVNSYISPKYAKLDRKIKAPGTPLPAAFTIWTPIFLGRIAYGFLKDKDRSLESSNWNHAISATGLTYAGALASERYYSMEVAMLAMTYASYKYRDSLPESDSTSAKAVAFAAELGFGWLLAADGLISAKNKQRLAGRKFTHAEQDIVGVGQAVLAAGGAIAANHLKGWSGTSVSAAWALGAIALDKRSEKHVRTIAAATAVGVLADLAFTTLQRSRSSVIDSRAKDGLKSPNGFSDTLPLSNRTLGSRTKRVRDSRLSRSDASLRNN